VETRNARKGEPYQLGFDITREMFDFVEGLWEPPNRRGNACLPWRANLKYLSASGAEIASFARNISGEVDPLDALFCEANKSAKTSY